MIPCKNCLVLSACKTRFKKEEGAVWFARNEECIILLRYLTEKGLSRDSYTKRINEVRRLYGMATKVSDAHGYYNLNILLRAFEKEEK